MPQSQNKNEFLPIDSSSHSYNSVDSCDYQSHIIQTQTKLSGMDESDTSTNSSSSSCPCPCLCSELMGFFLAQPIDLPGPPVDEEQFLHDTDSLITRAEPSRSYNNVDSCDHQSYIIQTKMSRMSGSEASSDSELGFFLALPKGMPGSPVPIGIHPSDILRLAIPAISDDDRVDPGMNLTKMTLNASPLNFVTTPHFSTAPQSRNPSFKKSAHFEVLTLRAANEALREEAGARGSKEAERERERSKEAARAQASSRATIAGLWARLNDLGSRAAGLEGQAHSHSCTLNLTSLQLTCSLQSSRLLKIETANEALREEAGARGSKEAERERSKEAARAQASSRATIAGLGARLNDLGSRAAGLEGQVAERDKLLKRAGELASGFRANLEKAVGEAEGRGREEGGRLAEARAGARASAAEEASAIAVGKQPRKVDTRGSNTNPPPLIFKNNTSPTPPPPTP